MSTTDFNSLDVYEEGVFPIIMIPKEEFAQYIRHNRSKARLVVIDGSYRWLMKQDDSSEVSVRPE